MNAAYHLAAIPEPYQILGLKLKPLSLGHYLLMQKFECAFVSETQSAASIEDLILGVLICSMDYDEFLAFAESDNFKTEIARWSHRINPLPLLARIPLLYNLWDGTAFARRWREKHSFNYIEKCQMFKRHIEEGSKLPPVWNEDDATGSGAHWSLGLKVALMSELGYTQKEALNMPLNEAFLDYFRLAENRGIVKMMTPDEVRQTNAMEAQCPA